MTQEKKSFRQTVREFAQQERSGGIVLGISIIVALIIANTPLFTVYRDILDYTFGFKAGGQDFLVHDVYHWINDGLMAVFFLTVGLELKVEFIDGELSTFRKAILPLACALGGMVGPAVIYHLLNPSGPEAAGWGIPMATDIAFAVGVLYLVGNKVPNAFKVFLLALAIFDDMGSVIVIALFYSQKVNLLYLGIGLLFALVLWIGNRLGIKNKWFYTLIGIAGVWYPFLESGVHATIGAVLIAFVMPVDVGKKANDALHLFVTFFVLPVFALANAGVSFAGIDPGELFNNHVILGVGCGLFFGKVIGIVGSLLLLVSLKVAPMPNGMHGRNLLGLGLLGAIGFTMSLFVTSLAFHDALHLDQAKIGIFSASILGGICAYCILSRNKPVNPDGTPVEA